jgi:methylthioribose-1-phosphate isomerase
VVAPVILRVVIAVVLFGVLAALAWWIERRRSVEAPTQSPGVAPTQLDRADFARPTAPWLVVLFTSKTCDSCEGLFDKAATLESDEVAVTEVEYFAHRDLHERYHVDAAPMTLIADSDGVVRASFLGAFAAPELWTAVAEIRAE